MIPLTADCMFKSIFTYDKDILKEFLILETGLSLDPKETSITILNNELPKQKQKESGDKKEDFLNKKLIQLNLNTENVSLNYGEDIILPYGVKTGKIYPQNKETILKYHAYYKNLYYNLGVKLDKDKLWLVVILSENFTELYDLLSNLLTEDKRDSFIRKVINMSEDDFILSKYERETLDKLKELARLEDAETKGLKKGLEQGLEQSKIEIAKNLLKNNISIQVIHESTGLSLDEIIKIKG